MVEVVREREFAKRVQERRKLLGKNQSQCAIEMGVSRQMWNNWDHGFCKPKNQRMRKLATVLKCDPVWLQHGHGNEVQERIERVNVMMRDIVRELSHIHQALGRIDSCVAIIGTSDLEAKKHSSKTDICSAKGHVRLTPKSGHWQQGIVAVTADDVRARFAEREQREAGHKRTQVEKWLNDPPTDRSALAIKNPRNRG